MLKLGIINEAVPRPQMPLAARQANIASMQTGMQNLNKKDLDWNFKHWDYVKLYISGLG